MEDEIKAVFLGFVSAMNQWELACAAKLEQFKAGEMTFSEQETIGMRELKRIQDRFCISGLVSRSYTFRVPPDYDPLGVHIDKVTVSNGDRKAEIYVTATCQGIVEKLKFRLMREEVGWRLQTKFRFAHDGSILQEENL